MRSYSVCIQHLLLLLSATGVFGLMAPRLFGQETPEVQEVRIEQDPTPVKAYFRPNKPTTLILDLKNPTKDGLSDVTVKLVQVLGGTDRPIAEAKAVKEILANGKVRLVFEKAKDNPDKITDLTGPPFKVQLQIHAKNGDRLVTIKRDLQLVILQPREYLTADAEFRTSDKKLSITVKQSDERKDLTGPQDCPVQLVFDPELEHAKKGIYGKTLKLKPGQSITLSAYDLAGTGFGKGRVFLKVDDYDRAFIYPLPLGASGVAKEEVFDNRVGVRLHVPRYTKPNAKFDVALELDGPLVVDGLEYLVEVGLDPSGENKDKPAQIEKYVGLRQQKISLSISSKNDLVCETKVADWKPQFDTAGVFGDIVFRVSVSKKDAKKDVAEKVTLAFSEEARPRYARLEPDDSDKPRYLYARATLDDSPAEEIEFVNLPKEWVVGKPLPVQVRIRKRESHQAPIEKVILFRGKAPKDDKEEIKAEDIIDTKSPDEVAGAKRTEWSFEVPAQDKAEPLALSVQFLTRAGVKAAKTATIAFKASSGQAKGLAKIKGVVKYGKYEQPKVPVTLADEKGKAKVAVKADDKGEFLFDNVPPGKYVVYSAESFRKLVGHTDVIEVLEGEAKVFEVTVRLLTK